MNKMKRKYEVQLRCVQPGTGRAAHHWLPLTVVTVTADSYRMALRTACQQLGLPVPPYRWRPMGSAGVCGRTYQRGESITVGCWGVVPS